MEATPEQAAEGLVVVRVLAAVLDRLVSANEPIARADPGQVTKFHAMKAPGIGIEQYLERILKYASCSNECFILALIYVDRLIQRNNFLLTELNVHRVVITAILLAAKFFDDAYYNNAYYAKVGGVLVSEMNGLEVDFLFRINFSLHVTPEIFEKYRAELLSHSASTAITQPPVHAPPPPPQLHPSPPAIICAPPATLYRPEVTMTVEVGHTASSKPSSQITPSPPAEAGRMVVDGSSMHVSQPPPNNVVVAAARQSSPLDFFAARVPVQRSNSLPVVVPATAAAKTAAWTQTMRCAQTPLSAPPVVVSGGMQDYLSPEDPYAAMVMESHHHHHHHHAAHPIYPIQGGLVHHGAGFAQPEPAAMDSYDAQRLGQMLTGVSGAGL